MEEDVVVALQHLAAVEVAMAFKIRRRILNVRKQQGDLAAELLLQPFVESEAFPKQLFNRSDTACRRLLQRPAVWSPMPLPMVCVVLP